LNFFFDIKLKISIPFALYAPVMKNYDLLDFGFWFKNQTFPTKNDAMTVLVVNHS